MSDSEYESDSPLSQFSVEDDEIIWTHGPLSDTDFIVLRHPLLDARSLSSTLSSFTGPPGSDGDLPSALDRLSLCDHDSFTDTLSSSAESGSGRSSPRNLAHAGNRKRGKTSRNTKPRAELSSTTSASSVYHSGTSTPTASYDDASAFISRCVPQPTNGLFKIIKCLSDSFHLQSRGAMRSSIFYVHS